METSPAGTTMFAVLPATTYYTQLIQRIEQAQRAITIVVFLIQMSAETEALFTALEEAARRGVRVNLTFDPFSRYYNDNSSLPPHRLQGRHFASTAAALDRLAAAGADIHELSKLGLNPYRGRCHTKFSVIDDTVFAFGGVNLYGSGLASADYMLRLEHPALAHQLHQLAVTIASGERQSDRALPIDANSTALIDSGRPGQSIIYDRALEWAGQSERIHYVSQYYPTGRLARPLRTTNTICYINRVDQVQAHVKMMLLTDHWRTRLANHYRGQRYLHAKFILFELKDGRKALLAGSHNFSWQGVVYGTQEIALASTDADLWQQLHQYLQLEIAV